MQLKLFAAEPTALLDYLEKLENASDEQVKLAASMFGEDDDEDPVDDIYDEDNGEFRIRIDGPLSMKGPSPLARLFGVDGCSYMAIRAACDRAAASACERGVIQFNTPGGDVNGVDLCYQAIAALAASKDVTAQVMGLCASAGYYMASACTRIEAMAPTCEIGSIGVKMIAIDDTDAMKADGYKKITIVSRNAPNKADASTKDGREQLQARADATEAVFLARVAEGRGVTPEYVSENYGRGGVLIANEALRVGMIDAVRMSLETPAVPDSSSRRFAEATGSLVAQADTTPHQEGNHMPTLKEFLASDPTARAELEKMLTEAKASGRAEIEARITAAKPFLALQDAAKGYSPAETAHIAKLAVDVIAGTEDAAALRSFVRMVDMQVEGRKQASAEAETQEQGETPAQLQEKAALLVAKAGTLKINVAQVEAAAKAQGLDAMEALEATIQSVEQLARDNAALGR